MRPEYYADLYRRYQTYLQAATATTSSTRSPCGPGTHVSDPNYHWTDALMKNAGAYMDALTLHYYTAPADDWHHKGTATDFTQRGVRRHPAQGATSWTTLLAEPRPGSWTSYDPEHSASRLAGGRVGHLVRRGARHQPGFLYQQNTMRDAMVAALTLNLFNKHADRVRMANIAQTVNVLQAVVLTDGAKMVLTPTYHVFDLYKVHQGATLLHSSVSCGCDEASGLPLVQESASRAADGSLSTTLCNPSASEAVEMETVVTGCEMELAERWCSRARSTRTTTLRRAARCRSSPSPAWPWRTRAATPCCASRCRPAARRA